ncbi:O-antigen ligase family protein [Cohnella sp. GCM10027633]|uniref:O-antigen ligase family protein n=1 Tax=unclassified Cohnella TaxID=2636738 RepID=UPI00362E97B5
MERWRIGARRLAAPAGCLFAAMVLGAGAYRSGLYFDREFYDFERMLYLGALALAIIGLWLRRAIEGAAWALLPLGMAALYGTSLLGHPASFQGSADAALRWLAYACWALLLGAVWRDRRSREWGNAAIQATGALLLITGWLGWLGFYAHPDIVMTFSDPEVSAVGARLAGYMQYPNAYGALLAAFLLMQLQVLATAEGKSRGWQKRLAEGESKGWQTWLAKGRSGDWQTWLAKVKSRDWQTWLAACTAVPYGGALLLTESRGSYAALLLGVALAIGLSPANRRARWISILGITAAGSVLTALAAWRWMPSADGSGDGISLGGGLAVIVCGMSGLAAFAAIRYGMSRSADGGRRLSRLLPWAAATIGFAGAYGLWAGTAGERLSGQYETATSRFLLYKDALAMFMDRPWFGYGGDSWRTMLGLYQSEPYVGNEVHNGYLAILLDTGVVGLTVLLAMLGLGLARMWRQGRREYIAPAVVLLAHAFVDFDWSYAFVWLLLLAWLQLHGGVSGRPHERAGAEVRGPTGARRRLGRVGLAALLAAGAAAGLWAATRSGAALEASGRAAIAASPEARAAHLRAALEANPAIAGIRPGLAPLLPLRERARLLAAGLRYEPQSAPLRLQLGIAYAELGDVAQAASSLREALRLDRFSREGQTAALAAMANLAASRHEAGDAVAAKEAAAAGAAFFARYRELARHVAAMESPANDRQFGLTIAAQYHAARCLLILGRREEAETLAREIARLDDEDWRDRALLLLDEPT